MSLTKELARRTAQILYPELWASNPLEAVAMAIEFLHEAAHEETQNSEHAPNGSPKTSAVVTALRLHMKRTHMHVNVAARGIGVSAYTIRTWLEGKYQPTGTNAKKIETFLEALQATPEILTPD